MGRKYFRLGSLTFFLLGMAFLLTSKFAATGAAVGRLNFSSTVGSIIGLSLITVSILLFIGGESLEERLKVKQTAVQQREGEYYLYDTRRKFGYSLSDVRKFAHDEESKRGLRKEYLSDLLRLYAEASGQDKERYKQFIVALSPNTTERHLTKRLKQFENIYERIKDRVEFMNPRRIKEAKPGDFGKDLYVRFENEQDTLWPEEGTIGFLPFDEVRVNPSRGPLFSVIENGENTVALRPGINRLFSPFSENTAPFRARIFIPLDRLIRDGYFVQKHNAVNLNPKWGSQSRRNYLRDTYGIDVGPGQRRAVRFQIEKGTTLENYGNYQNIVIKDRIPLVKVIKKD